MKVKLLRLTIFLVVMLNLFSSVFILYQTERTLDAATAFASNQGNITLCINHPPSLDVPCAVNMSQDVPYTCQLNGSDPEGSLGSYSQLPEAPDAAPLFDISATGLINFTPNNSIVGNHSVMLYFSDESACDNHLASYPFNYTVQNVNDPPYLIRAIPAQSFDVNTTLFAFFLSDYFDDPDDDVLTYTFLRGSGDIFINITLNPDSSVVFEASDCGKAHFQFTATDPGNLFANSNAVQVEVTCPEEQTSGESEGNSGSGAGGGGGGGACFPELVCLPWSDCYPTGKRIQVCQDKNGCDDEQIKFYQNCTYVEEVERCPENWLCSDWTPCSMAGVQNRTCIDLSSCGTERYRPVLKQECLYQPTCNDGVQNGDETGVDCGGSCPACKTIQQPTLLPETKSFSSFFTLLAILFLAILLALFVLYRERIYEGLAELGWLMARRKKKETLLTQPEKRMLFERLSQLVEEAATLAPVKAYEGLAISLRTYLSFIYDLPFEFLPGELDTAMVEKKLSAELQEMLRSFSRRLDFLEGGKLPVDELNEPLFSSVLEELHLFVCLTSEYTLAEISRELFERPINDSLSFTEEIRLRLLNGYEALEFLRAEAAQEEYKQILRAYENLDALRQAQVYPDIRRFYLQIRYVAETSEA